MEQHDLNHELPEYREQIHALKMSNGHFARLFDEYHDVNRHVVRVEVHAETATDFELEDLKKRRLKLKDELYEMLKGATVKVAVAHGIGNVEYVLNRVVEAKRKGEEPPYHFIEVMACPGGCIGGGGQPYGITNQIRAARAAGLYEDDRDSAIRYSHENPSVKALYDEYIGKPLGERSHHLFHTGYTTYSEYKR